MPGDNATLLMASAVSAGYRGVARVADIDLAVEPGDFLVLLGANGSGKSTLMRAVSGQISLLTGAVRIDGIDMASTPEAAKRSIGYAVEPYDLPETLTGAQYLDLIASIRGCSARDWPCDELDEVLQFRPWLRTTISAYSLGTRMKLSIMGALLGAPKLLLLDESLNGLDPLMLFRVRRIFAALCAKGHGVILSTHMVGTIGADCTGIVFLEHGRCRHRWTRREIDAAQGQPGGLEAMVIAALEMAN